MEGKNVLNRKSTLQKLTDKVKILYRAVTEPINFWAATATIH